MPAIELVILDCDGTLMDSEGIAAEVETAALETLGMKLSVDAFQERFAGTSSAQVHAAIEAETGRPVPDDFAKKIDEEIVRRFRMEAKAIDGAHEMLDRFDQPRCVCSNSSMEKLEAELRRAQLWDRFRPYIFSARDMTDIEEKPAPDVFLHACRTFDVEPRAALVVEDSVSGITGAVAAGCRTVGFTGAGHVRPGHADRLTEAGAETVVSRLLDVPPLIAVFGEWEGASL